MENNCWGSKPSKAITDFLNLFNQTSSVLDLGAGEGRNSIYLAKGGFKVTAIDISKESISKLKKYSEKENLKIKSVVGNIVDFLKKPNKFNIILGVNVLQYISKEKLKKVIKDIQDKTVKNGFNIMSSFIYSDKKSAQEYEKRAMSYFFPGELKEFYSNWKILFYKEEEGKMEQHGDEPPHKHTSVTLVAQKI